MTDEIAKAIGGFFGGLTAGLIGFVTDLAVGATLGTFQTISLLFIPLGVVYAIVSFILGVEQAYTAGVFFAFGIIAAGLILSDLVTIIGGIISFGGLVFSFFRGSSD